MVTSVMKERLDAPVERVWRAVTAVEEYAVWRSDLNKAEWLSGDCFAEYGRNGQTLFRVTLTQPLARWEFELENPLLKGNWRGDFEAEGGETLLTFTENVQVKKGWLRPFVKGALRRQQKRFMEDLKRFLEL